MSNKNNNNRNIFQYFWPNIPASMSLVIIGDIHGRPIWTNIVSRHPNAEIIFLGDYFDSKEGMTGSEQIENFNKIIGFKKSWPKKVTLLLGNHDYHYLPFAGETYSGYQYAFAMDIRKALEQATGQKLLKICKSHRGYLFSHAGLTKTWCLRNDIPISNPVNAVNNLFYRNPGAFRFSPGPRFDSSGNEPEQGPLWVRPPSLFADNLPGATQVVGHTQRKTIQFLEGVIVVDVLSYSCNYLEINSNKKPIVHTCMP